LPCPLLDLQNIFAKQLSTGRIAWNTLLVRDKRHVKNLDAMFAECLEHQRLATADGSLKAVSKFSRQKTDLQSVLCKQKLTFRLFLLNDRIRSQATGNSNGD